MNELRDENEKLRRILDVSLRMASPMALDDLLHVIVDAVCDVLACERATIFLYDAESDELVSRVARGVDEIRVPATEGIVGVAAQHRRIVNIADAYADSRFNQEVDKRTGYHTRNLLTLPLENLEGELIGVLQALNKVEDVFHVDDEELARVFAAQAGVALDRGRLIEAYAEKRRMERDLQIARRIQQDLLPKDNPEVAGFEIAGWNRSADETGGDTYDFMRLEDGSLAVVLADATGHGIGAALIIAQFRSILRSLLTVTTDLRLIAGRLNNLLSEDLADNRFVTAFIGILDPQKREMSYIAAGQGPLLMVKGPSDVEMRYASAPPLAVIPDYAYGAPERFDFPSGATLALLTDGFFEASNEVNDQFGERRIIDAIRRYWNAPPAKMITDLYADISTFTGAAPQADDLTALIVRGA
ncbi:MAG: SpoIIE family protein phosphatase [Phycisphaerales bacterium]|nr:SpoIIE family protein phosphatase [Phycisphaerales bacterium]